MTLLLVASALNPVMATVLAMSEREMLQRSDVAAFGSVLAIRHVASESGWTHTQADIQLFKIVRGPEVGSVITIEVPGGPRSGGIVDHVAGSPNLQAGQLWFGFFQKHGDHHIPLALKYSMLRGRHAADGSYRVYRDLDGVHVTGRADVVTLDEERLDDLCERLGTLAIELKLQAPGHLKR